MEVDKMIVAIGDTHGNFDSLILYLEKFLTDQTNVHFVQVGDFGIGFEPRWEYQKLSVIDLLMEESNSKFYAIRGNHDNPAYWNEYNGFEFDNIEFVEDDSILILDEKKCYFAGGAISIDRRRRKRGLDYWRGEEYNMNRKTVNLAPHRIDVLFTHDVYHGCSPFTTNNPTVNHFIREDEYLEFDIINHNKRMETLYREVLRSNPNFSWYHGHYHESHVTVIGEQKTHSLDIFEFKEVK